ncbi:hypothetical protein B0H03_11272 [Rathayibacter iranicus NCPPB 2253 = VKM Ac-1602]|uniref:Uncharacterized protein n=1 Tax=Rathayibacter iranicus NCPPB 2253 = VKM Ac-1602 TaxID=1328868 RepID=A0ABX5LA25_9MICO|nr:hypothetical protein B0H03_11272 [Rathayibacter iranicus NCPPB 2253 = VKM Ac-1602]
MQRWAFGASDSNGIGRSSRAASFTLAAQNSALGLEHEQ